MVLSRCRLNIGVFCSFEVEAQIERQIQPFQEEVDLQKRSPESRE
jgi:hypothetical protein